MVYDRPTAPTPSKPPPPPVHPTPVRAAADPGYTRLHITPFDAELLSVVVPASARPDARNVSFHSLQTFPEKRYGFVDLPNEAAEKLRRKLNGAVLKGVKLSIEAARQADSEKKDEQKDDKMGKKDKKDKNLTPEEQKLKDEERAARKEKKRVDKEKARAAAAEKKGPLSINAEHEKVVGVQLEPGRQVRRGWTEPESAVEASTKKTNWSKDKKDKKDGKEKKDKTSKKRAEKSEYTDKPECLFKTILPASKVAAPVIERDSDGDEVDPRAAKRARKEAKKAREVVVHEFANWTKIPTFLKAGAAAGASSSSGPNLEYVEGKGWVDESSGDVVQPLQSTRPATVKGVITKEMQLAKRAKLDRLAAERAKALKESSTAGDESETSDSGSDTSSSGESSDDEEEVEEKEENAKEVSKDEPVPSAEESPARPQSSASAKNLMIKIPPPPAFAAAAPPSTPGPKKEVHPLEALYKRAKPEADAANNKKTTTSTEAPAAEASQPFSFFGGINNDDIEEEEDVDAMDVVATENDNDNDADAPQPPMTPFGRAEFEWRNVRSAAPTPDTAHPSRMTSNFKWPTPGGASDEEDDDDEDEDEDDKEKEDGADKKRAAGEGDFQSWFWDNRGDLNRSWKRRRKTAAKDKRYRENRARAERAI